MAMITQSYRVIIHEAEEGGYWGEVLELPGCVSQGETLDELQQNIREAIEAVSQASSDKSRVEFQVQSVIEHYRLIPSEPLVGSNLVSGSVQTWTAAS